MSHLSPDFDVLFLQHNEYPFQLFLRVNTKFIAANVIPFLVSGKA